MQLQAHQVIDVVWNPRTVYGRPINDKVPPIYVYQLAGKRFLSFSSDSSSYISEWPRCSLTVDVNYSLFVCCLLFVVLLCHTDGYRAKRVCPKWRAVRSVDITLRSRIHVDSYRHSHTYGVEQGVSFAVPRAR